MIAGHHDEPPLRGQRREDPLEGRQLALEPTVGQVAGGDDLVDPERDLRRAEPRRVVVVLGAAPDVKVRNVRESRALLHASTLSIDGERSLSNSCRPGNITGTSFAQQVYLIGK